MSFTKAQQTTIETALALAGISYDSIDYRTNGRVEIKQQVTDQETLFLAEVGIFKNLKPIAIQIWDTLGVSDETGEIEYFIVWCDGLAFAKFVIFPDMRRTEYNSRDHSRPESNWDQDRDELVLEAAIQVEEEGQPVEVVVEEVIERHFVGTSSYRAKLRFILDLRGLLKPAKPVDLSGLTPAEREIYRLAVEQRLTDEQIAAKLRLLPAMVGLLRQTIARKLEKVGVQ